MFQRHDVFLETYLRDREAWVMRFAAERQLLRGSGPARRRTLRERLGYALIHAGRALVRHHAPYAAARRRLA